MQKHKSANKEDNSSTIMLENIYIYFNLQMLPTGTGPQALNKTRRHLRSRTRNILFQNKIEIVNPPFQKQKSPQQLTKRDLGAYFWFDYDLEESQFASQPPGDDDFSVSTL